MMGFGWAHGRTLMVASALLGALGCSPAPAQPQHVSRMEFAPRDIDDDAVETPRRRRAPRARAQARPPRKPQCLNHGKSVSSSIGLASNGRLANGCLLPKRGPGYVRRNKSGYGTDDVVGMLQWACAEVAKLYAGSVPVVVGALSRQGGGRLRPHKSHQSGRDIDVGYFASENRALPHFRKMHVGNIDAQKSWALIGALVSTGRVQYIFMDYELQAVFYRHLADLGTPEATLNRLFQFPRGRRTRAGLIRHAGGHADHFHVRFYCGRADDASCR